MKARKIFAALVSSCFIMLSVFTIAVACIAGGEGAESCSYESCSVSCQSGYYACCNANGCKCVRASVN